MSTEIQNRCVNMIANLYHAYHDTIGTSTVGSSEALMLCILALKRRWQLLQKSKGRDITGVVPNLILPANVQVCVEKAARYLELEERYVYCDEEHLCLNPEKAAELVDENTVGIVCILGSTYTGEYEDVAKMNELLEKVNKKKNLDVRIHVDAASGG
jgi:glutamate decarboxylase